MEILNFAVGNSRESQHQTPSEVDPESLESEWVDEEDDDDMDFEPEADSIDQDADFFDPSEDVEAEFHGMTFICLLVSFSDLPKAITNVRCYVLQTLRMD